MDERRQRVRYDDEPEHKDALDSRWDKHALRRDDRQGSSSFRYDRREERHRDERDFGGRGDRGRDERGGRDRDWRGDRDLYGRSNFDRNWRSERRRGDCDREGRRDDRKWHRDHRYYEQRRRERSPDPSVTPKHSNMPQTTQKIPNISDVPAEEVDEDQMAAIMGFGNFGTSKGKNVEDNSEGFAEVRKERTWRQYMNRRGGFNRPLDKI